MYPISKMLLQTISGSTENKLSIVKKLGFKNLSKGLRRLDHLIHTGQCPESLRDKLPFALGLNPEVIERAFNDTLIRQNKEEEDARIRREEHDRTSFQPHIWIRHELENPPVGSICIVGFIGIEHWEVIQLPEDIMRNPWSQQFRLVREKIKKHQQREDVGRSIFGSVLGYLYRKTYDKGFLFSPDGTILEIYNSTLPHLDIQIRIGKERAPGKLLKP